MICCNMTFPKREVMWLGRRHHNAEWRGRDDLTSYVFASIKTLKRYLLFNLSSWRCYFGKVVFQIFTEIEMTRNENQLFGSHFETVQIFFFCFCLFGFLFVCLFVFVCVFVCFLFVFVFVLFCFVLFCFVLFCFCWNMVVISVCIIYMV